MSLDNEVPAEVKRTGMPVRIVREDPPSEVDIAHLRDALDSWNVATTGHNDYARVAIFLRDESDRIRGGIVGDIWARWLHVSHLWVEADLRRRGLGSQLLADAEQYAAEQGCGNVHLDTFDFQAGPSFYRRHGYEVFGVLRDHPPGGTHFFLRKALSRPRRE